jgi:hypothetical protein
VTAVQSDGGEGRGRAPNKVLQRSWASDKQSSSTTESWGVGGKAVIGDLGEIGRGRQWMEVEPEIFGRMETVEVRSFYSIKADLDLRIPHSE